MGVPTAYQNSDSDSSTTKSAVEKGELIIRNKEQQKQDISELSRDTESANNPLKQIFDKQKELDKIETVELIKDIAQQAKSVMNKYDRIQAQNDVDKNKDALSKLEAEKAYNKLSDAEKAKYKTVEDYYNQNKDYFYYVAVDEQLKTNRENNKNLGGMGSDVSKGIDSAISIVTGIITGDITGGLAGASAPWVAEQIKKHTGHKEENGNWKTDDIAGNLIVHAILGAVVAELQGNSGLAGGAGAVTGELAADIIRKQLYGKDVKDLTEAEKENISALAQLATGLAVASVGGDVGDVSTGIAAGKNAVENNGFNSLEQGANWSGFIGLADETGSNYDSILHASANGYLTYEETVQLLEDMNSGKFMYDPVREQFERLPKDIAILLTPYGDYIAFRDAETWGDYAIATVGVLPFAKYIKVAGKVVKVEKKAAQTLVKEAEAAYKAGDIAKGNKLLNEVASQSKQVETTVIRNSDSVKGTATNKPLDKTDLELQHGKGKVEQGGGHHKDTKDKILDNQATNQKANESSNFGEHVKKEQEINAGKGTTGNSLEWNSWQNYKKTTIDGKQYAQIGDRLYSQHAVDRMQPSGLGSPAGTVGAGRNISPGIVEHTIQNGTKTSSTVNGVERTVHWSGDVGVVTESNGKIIVTILRRSEK